MPSIGVSVLNHQAADATIRCVQSLMQESGRPEGSVELTIQLADNHSDPDDFDRLAAGLAHMENLQLTRHESNLGFSAGHNRNIDRLLEQGKPDYVWLLNNDCILQRGALTALIQCAEQRPEVGIWGVTLLEDDAETIQCAGGCFYNSWISSYRQCGQGRSLADLESMEQPRFDYIAGASLFMPIETLMSGLSFPTNLEGNARDQWLNERFFLYFEELDLSKRLAKGLELGWCREAKIVHARSEDARSTERTMRSEYHSTLSALKFTQIYYPERLWAMMPLRYLAKTVQLVFSGRAGLISCVHSAYRDFIRTALRKG